MPMKDLTAPRPRPLQTLTLLSTAFSVSAWADAPSQATPLDTVVVTATALALGDTPAPALAGGHVALGGRLGLLGEQSSREVPFTVVGYTATAIANQQAHTVGDVLRRDASVQTAYSYGNYGQSYKIRGFDLYPDDIAFSGLYGVMPRQIIDTSAIERIELFKGSSAFMNGVPSGGTGVGGTVNLEPKLAEDSPLTRVGMDYGRYGQWGTSLDVGQRFGRDEAFGLRFNGLRRSGDTAIDHEHRSTTSGTLALDYRGDRIRSALIIGQQRQHIRSGKAGLNTFMLVGEHDTLPAPPDPTHNFTPLWTWSTLDADYGLWRGEVDLTSNWTLFGALGGSRNDEQGVYSSPSLTRSEGTVSYSRMDTVMKSQRWASTLGLRGQFTTPGLSHAVTLGYSGTLRKQRSAYTLGNTHASGHLDQGRIDVIPAGPEMASGGRLGHPQVVARDAAHGFAASDTLGFFDDRVKLTLGLRYQTIRVINNDYQGQRRHRDDQSTVTPVYGVVYRLSGPWSLYANHIEALQPGPTAGIDSANAGETLGIVRSRQDEVGLKVETDTVGGGLSLFTLSQPTARHDAQRRLVLDGEQRHQGVELSLYGAPMTRVRLESGLTFMDATLRHTQDGAQDGHRPMGVARYQARLGGEWDMPGWEGLTLTGMLYRTGPQYADAANRLALSSWTRLDLGARYTTQLEGHPLTWRASVENVTQARYWEGVSTFGYLTQGTPRTFSLSATLDI